MISAGNDIVALNSRSARAGSKRFYSKILCDQELALYNGQIRLALPLYQYVWLIWSVKEAVYKFQQQSNGLLRFAPKKMRVQNIRLRESQDAGFTENAGNGMREWQNNRSCHCTVISHEQVFYTRSFIYSDYIHTVANNHPCFDNISWCVRQITQTDYDTQSGEVRLFLLKRLREIFPGTPLRIGKHSSGYPLLLNNDSVMPVPLSFTHDEQFIAWSFNLPPGIR